MSADQMEIKVDPESLELRARPKPITRISRKVLFGGIAVLLFLIAGAVLLALDPPGWNKGEQTELYQPMRTTKPDGLSDLPSTYDNIPTLGPPNPGDIGKSLSRLESDLGILPASDNPTPSFVPDPEADFLRAERIRLARLQSEAQQSSLFFNVNTRPEQSVEIEIQRGLEVRNYRNQQSELLALNALNNIPAIPGTIPAPGEQADKLAFMQQNPDMNIYNTGVQQEPVSPYQLMAGTVIAAALVTGLNSDLPGMVIAQVTENVFDSISGQYLLIPQGTRLIGQYDSMIAFGQERSLVIWQRIIRPDGSSITIDNLPATDPSGYAGLSDEVDLNTWEVLKGIALSTLLGVGTELTFGNNESDLVKIIRESTQQSTNRAGQKLVDQTLNIQPTITVRPGWPLRIIVNKDIILTPYVWN